jgi:tetratricopeptide (TPR) repeat protein
LSTSLFLGEIFQKKGNFKKALALYREVIGKYPYSMTAVEQLGKLDETLTSEDLKQYPPEIGKYITIRTHMHKNDYKSALDLVKKDCQNVELLLCKFECEFRLSKTKEAIATMKNIYSLDSFHHRMSGFYAYLLKSRKDFPELNKLTMQMMSMYPTLSECWICVAANFERQEMFETAYKAIEKALLLGETPFGLFLRGLILMKQKKYFEAISAYKAIVHRDILTFMGLIQTFLVLGRVDEAIIEGKLLMKAFPSHILSFCLMGQITFKQGDMKTSRKWFERGMKAYDGEEDIYEEIIFGLVEIDIREENYENALNYLKKRMEIQQNDILHVKIGNIYIILGKHKDALYHFNTALTFNGFSEEAKKGIAKLENILNPSNDFE